MRMTVLQKHAAAALVTLFLQFYKCSVYISWLCVCDPAASDDRHIFRYRKLQHFDAVCG